MLTSITELSWEFSHAARATTRCHHHGVTKQHSKTTTQHPQCHGAGEKPLTLMPGLRLRLQLNQPVHRKRHGTCLGAQFGKAEWKLLVCL